MNITDLEKFLVIADTQNLQSAAEKLNSSASVLSKSLKRLENQLDTKLFDRIGKSIQLNPAGELLVRKAAQIVSQAKQTRAEFAGLMADQSYRIAGPSVLLFRWASVITRSLLAQQSGVQLRFDSVFEQAALNAVVNGSADLGLITTAIASQLPEGMHQCQLGSVTMQVAAARNHPLVNQSNENEINTDLQALLGYAFATPNISPYCGESRGIGCDGWQNQIFPRKLQMVVNDYSVLTQLVRSGMALAYLPDYWLREWGLVRINVTDCPYQCHENLLLISWQQDLLQAFDC